MTAERAAERWRFDQLDPSDDDIRQWSADHSHSPVQRDRGEDSDVSYTAPLFTSALLHPSSPSPAIRITRRSPPHALEQHRIHPHP